MQTSQATVTTTRPERYGKQLASHFSRKVEAEWSDADREGAINFQAHDGIEGARCTLSAGEGVLHMRIDGTSDAVERCEQVEESLKANNIVDGSERHQRVIELLEHAGLPDAERRATQFPHEFSGGMRQRALIAMGLAANPELLIADEPTSALDVTVQKRILDHLETLTQESQTALLFITHDLGLAAERADHLLVMHRGRVVERGPSLDILRNPKHPYTRRLVDAAPSLAAARTQAASIGEGAKAVETKPEDVVIRVDKFGKGVRCPRPEGGQEGVARRRRGVLRPAPRHHTRARRRVRLR